MVAANEVVRKIQSEPFTANEDIRQDVRTLYLEGIDLSADALRLPIETCFALGLTAGWWHNLKDKQPITERNFGDIIALIHSEVSESYEAHRKNKNDDHLPQYKGKVVELVDAVIRIFDYVGSDDQMKKDFLESFAAKLKYNANRADHKPENRLQDGGKKL